MERHEQPPVAAAFLVVFDLKVGHLIAWKRSISGVDFEHIEYKCMPSGLHDVREDTVYFTQSSHAGVSVFVQEEADAKQRYASFAAVGVLVPQSHGSLGRSWTHVEELRSLAKSVVKDPADTRALELFWKKHGMEKRDTGATVVEEVPRRMEQEQPDRNEGRKRKRAMSEATIAGLAADAAWSKDHPALYVPTLLDTFGPLLFPLHRAALLRKRVLFLGSAPVQRQASTVYLASVLSNISRTATEFVPTTADPLLRSNPLYSVNVLDLTTLMDDKAQRGWIACSTDDILGEKKGAYDLLVVLPSFQRTPDRQWPKLKLADGTFVKATQRDLRRWRLLRREVRRLQRQSEDHDDDTSINEENEDNDQRPLLSRDLADGAQHDSRLRQHHEAEIVEPSTWSALAYKGFMWWASAGEAAAWESDEAQADEELLFDMPDLAGLVEERTAGDEAEDAEGKEVRERQYARAAATLVVAYFRRVTEQMLRTLAEVVELADERAEGDAEEGVELSMDDVRAMGLDGWSETDKAFVAEMARVWFGREAKVVGGGVRICGLRVC